MSVDTSFEAPDWSAINAAHRQAAVLGLPNPNARPVGAISIDQAFSDAALDMLPPVEAPPALPRKSNGFGGHNRTFRAESFPSRDSEPRPSGMELQLDRLAELQAAVGGEIEDPDRCFWTWVEVQDQRGSYQRRQYIYDEGEIEEFRQHERIAAAKVVDAMRIRILERQPSTRGFPGRHRTDGSEDQYRNVERLRAEGEQSKDVLLLALLNDMEERLAQDSGADTRSRFGNFPQWQRVYELDQGLRW